MLVISSFMIFSGVLYGSLLLVPALLYLISHGTNLGKINVDYGLVVCVYGYSTVPLIPVSIMCSMPWVAWQNFIILLGFFVSMASCYKYLWIAATESLPRSVRGTLLLVALVGQLINWAAYKFLFLTV